MDRRKILITVRRIWLTAGLFFIGWLFYSYQPHGVDPALLESGRHIKVEETGNYFCFQPEQAFTRVLIFYPGAMVAPKAYVPLCRALAGPDTKVYLIKMPWRQAFLGYNLPKELRLFADSSKTYILAGHSQGAKMAAQFVYENPDLVQKLILIGTTHPKNFSLADRHLPTIKIYGSMDGVAEPGDILANRKNLPPDTEYIGIKGANHAQFGYYGFQLGDHAAAISREAQLEATLSAINKFMNK